MVQDTVNYREKNNITRNDFMQLLIQIKNRSKVEEEHSYLEQNGHGNLENKSDGNGMYLLYAFHVKYYIQSWSCIDELLLSIVFLNESAPHTSG
jgi:energy-converting hydrogenase A subunit M